MSWEPIVVGVDASPEAVRAADFATRLARTAHTRCQLVHAVSEPWTGVASLPLAGALVERGRALVADALHGVLRDPDLLVRLGPRVRVLSQAVADAGAELVVLGGKHHGVLDCWLGGSTAHNAVRALPVPVLVTRDPPASVRRVLVAADVSAAAGPTIAAAERVAALWGARVRAVNVLEPFPAIAEAGFTQAPEYYAVWEEMLQRDVWPLLRSSAAETGVRHGHVVPALRREVADWGADLLVVGSHGKGWVDRLLIGSVTERLLRDLPASLLVVPVAALFGAKPPAARTASELAARPLPVNGRDAAAA
ncbi:MAG: universal stress protein, partial [Acidimicrobiales bacterium]